MLLIVIRSFIIAKYLVVRVWCGVFSGVIFTIFDFKKRCDLEICVSGHSKSLKVVPFDRLHMISY